MLPTCIHFLLTGTSLPGGRGVHQGWNRRIRMVQDCWVMCPNDSWLNLQQILMNPNLIQVNPYKSWLNSWWLVTQFLMNHYTSLWIPMIPDKMMMDADYRSSPGDVVPPPKKFKVGVRATLGDVLPGSVQHWQLCHKPYGFLVYFLWNLQRKISQYFLQKKAANWCNCSFSTCYLLYASKNWGENFKMYYI